MEKPLKKKIINVLNRVGIEELVRDVYYKIRLMNSKMSIQNSGLTCSYKVNTLALFNYINHFAEQQQLHEFIERLMPDDIVWDVGANYGVYSTFAAKKIENRGKVYSFEPNPDIYNILKENFGLNNLKNINALNVALGDYIGESKLFKSGSNFGAFSMAKDNSISPDRGFTIKVSTGANIAATIQPPSVMKIDVEGFEVKVLKGMGDLLQRTSLRFLFCEVHPKMLPLCGDSVDDVRKIIRDAGFVIVNLTNRGSEMHWICTRE